MKLLFIVLTSMALGVVTGISAPPDTGSAKFRVKFQAYDGDPAKPATMSFQINTLDFRHPVDFPKQGETIPHTGLKLESFQQKKRARLNAEPEDVSERILLHVPSNQRFVLPLNKIVDIPVAAPSRNK